MRHYSALLTDHYQLVMAFSYWKLGLAEREAIFHLCFRKLPISSPFLVVVGLQQVIEYIANFKFSAEDIVFLSSLKAGDQPLYPQEFLHYLQQLRITCDLDAIPEGTLAFANEPILRIRGPLLQCQLLETALINIINFGTLIATKAARISSAAGGDPVIEFGLRRAQGPDGGLSASRSAYIGGCAGTSNVLASQQFGIPLYGTQAHSWIMAFETEPEAFNSFAQINKSQSALLVDTYNTLQGIKHAVEVGLALKQENEHLAAIRLDSGCLVKLSKQARKMLDKAGLYETKIMVSGDLDEHRIQQLKQQEAPINLWGVGTKLVTCYEQPALNAIYKLSALKNKQGEWEYKMKLSDDSKKSTLPGIQQIRRFYQQGYPIKDQIFDIQLGNTTNDDFMSTTYVDLLIPILRQGILAYHLPTIEEVRSFVIKEVNAYLNYPNPYPVDIDKQFQLLIMQLSQKLKSLNG